MATVLLFTAFVSFLLFILIRFCGSKSKALADKLPGPPTRLFVGNAFDVPLSGPIYVGSPKNTYYRKNVNGVHMFPECESSHRELFNTYGLGFRVWGGPNLFYMCASSLDIETLLKSVTEIKKSFIYNYLRGWLGEGLLFSTGEKWHMRRKAITPSFHFQILEDFIEIFEKHSKTLVSCMENRVGQGEFELTPYTGAYTLDVITETSMRTHVNAQRNPNNKYVKSTRDLARLIVNRMNSPWFLSDTVYKLFGQYNKEQNLISVLRDHYLQIVKSIDDSAPVDSATLNSEDDISRRNKIALLPSLLKLRRENNPAFKTDEDIREEVETFVFEGHDTTTAGINFALGCLARYPEIQEKAFEEVKEVLGNIERPSIHDLNQLKYLERVIKETLRLYPSVPFIARQLNADVVLPSSGHLVPADTTVVLHFFMLHRNPLHFPNPLVFDPDNFLPENIEKRPTFAYLPFSSGPRNCIGQKFAMLELKYVLAKLLLNYKFSCEPGTSKDIPVSFELTLQSANGHKVAIAKR